MGTSLKISAILVIVAVFLACFPLQVVPVNASVVTQVKNFYASTNDGFLYTYNKVGYFDAWYPISADYANTTGTAFDVGQENKSVAANYSIYRAFLYFDTSQLPDTCTILNATLYVYLTNTTTDKNFLVQIQNGQPNYPHNPMVLADYYYTHYSGNGGSANASTMSLGYNTITLSGTGFTWLSKNDGTKLCLRSNREIGGAAPTNATYASFSTTEAGISQAPYLRIGYQATGYVLRFYGAYTEHGVRSGAINVTVHQTSEAAETFSLNGSNTVVTASAPTLCTFDLGYNYTRTYYLRTGAYYGYEEIYVFEPDTPYDVYLFTVTDFVGMTNGFLESTANINGTDRVVERLPLTMAAALPFILSWNHVYKMRVVSDQGTIDVKTIKASSVRDMVLFVGSDIMPWTRTGLENVSATATRLNTTLIQVVYADRLNQTVSVTFLIYDYSNVTSPVFNATYYSNGAALNWNYGGTSKTYFVDVTAQRSSGTFNWQFALSDTATNENPFRGMSVLGELPFEAAQIFAAIIILLMIGAFSYFSMVMGLISTFMTFVGLAYMNWLTTTIPWIVVVGFVTFTLVFSIGKGKQI